MKNERTLVEKLIDGEVNVGDCDLIADFDHEEIRTLLDEHVIEPRHLPEILASDMVIGGMLDYGEYPFEDFSPHEQLRQLDGKAIGDDEFWKKIDVEEFEGDDMNELLRHITGVRIIVQEGEADHE